jgi:hypothetical protein
MSGQTSASSSIGEPRSNISAQPEPASGSFSDPVELVNTLGTSSGMLLPALVEASPPGRAAKAISVGIILYLASVGIIAVATIGIFFGIGFFLLAQSTAAIIASDTPTEQGHATGSHLPYLLSKVLPTSGDAGSVPIQPEIPRLDATIARPVAALVTPSPPQISASTTSPTQDRSVGEASLGLSTSEPSPPASKPVVPAVETARDSSVAVPALPVDETPQSSSVAAVPAAAQVLSTGQITELLTRGDTFLHAGDLTSARLFYERAADAGDREAAMRMGATFDPAFLDRVGLHARGDAAKALSWYRHALDLAAPKTDRQAQSSQAK